MSKYLVVQFGVFYALLFPGAVGFVPPPTNVSVVCHNFVNILYWNYSKPTEQTKFGIKVEPYESPSQTVDTSQTYLDISSYSRNADDDYLVFVTAHDGQEKSENVSIRFTYSKDYFDKNKHKYKCSMDFPAVNTSVHKDMIKVFFQHPFMLHKQDLLNEEFTYTITHDEQMISYPCFEDEELCTAEIHFNQSIAGQCVELKIEGMIAGIPSYTYRNVCVPQQTPETVPPPTNVSVVCHNFVNILYWNYSKPTEQTKFGIKVEPYESASQTVDTSQTYLDISSYSRNADDDYLVFVTAHDGQEKSENVSIRFTYSKDYFDKNKHKYKCSMDFPAVNTSVHKDMIKVFFQHPFMLHKQDLLNEEFTYTITHDEQMISYPCFEDEELCTAEIHFNQSIAGQCVELKIEGMIAGIPSYTYRNVCVPQQTPETDKTGIIAALVGGGTIVLFIIMGFVWLLCKKLSQIPKIPEFLRNVLPSQSPATQPEITNISRMTSQGHTPLLTEETFNYGSTPSSPTEEDCKANTILDDTVVDLREVSEGDMDGGDSEGFVRSSDYDSPKFLQEMGPGDFTEGYGPRPPVI